MMKSWALATRAACSISSMLATGIAEGNIVGNGIIEQYRFLGNNAHLVAQRKQGIFFDIDAIDQQFTTAYIMKTGNQVGQGRFYRRRKNLPAQWFFLFLWSG